MKNQASRTSTPVRAIQTSRHLQMTHHRHSGRVLPRRSTSYPMLAMIILCVGVFLTGWTRMVTAATFVYPGPQQAAYNVTASVPGPPPTVAATIDTPTEGTTFSALPITVAGSCPPNTYVTLYRNGAFSGVSICDAGGTWQVDSGLFVGANKLEARVFSSTDLPGPLSVPVNVVYTPATPAAPATSPGTTDKPAATGSPGATDSGTIVPAEPLLFKTTYNYEGHYVGQSSTWQLELTGGNPPYAISVDWGDGTHDLISRPRSGVFSIDHTYKKRGGYHGSYVVKFSASDAAGNQTYLQLLSIINDPAAVTGVTNKPGNIAGFVSSAPSYLHGLFKYVWPSYGVVVLMLASFWLGERRELRILQPLLKKNRHRHA